MGGGEIGALRPGDDCGGGGGAEGGNGDVRNGDDEFGGGGGAAEGTLTDELVRRPAVDPGMGGGLPGAGEGMSFALFAAAVTRRFTILDVGRTWFKFSETLRGMAGVPHAGLLGANADGPEGGGGGGGGARATGAGMGGFPVPTMVDGRFGVSTELVRGR